MSGILDTPLICYPASVSYTHLDVYKRQDKEEEREKDLEADAEKGRTAHFLLKQLLLWAAVSLVFPAAICILWGRERLLELRYLLAAAAGGLLLLLVVFDVITMLAVSYTHLDVYKRQGERIVHER